jgi:hypothetical protein
MEVVWAAPPTGAHLARQGRFASLRDGLRPPLDPRASARPDGRRRGRSETCLAHSRGPDGGLERARIRPTETSVDPFFARIRRDGIVAVMVAQPLQPLAAPTTANHLLSYVIPEGVGFCQEDSDLGCC